MPEPSFAAPSATSEKALPRENSLRSDAEDGALPPLLCHREAAALCLDAPHRDHHRLHAHRDRGGDDEIQLRDAHQAGRNPDEGNGRRHAAYRHRDGQLWARQFRSRRSARRARAGDQKRRGVAVAGNVGDRGLALFSSGRGHQRTVRRGEQAGGAAATTNGKLATCPLLFTPKTAGAKRNRWGR
jgi:hypothetical protein